MHPSELPAISNIAYGSRNTVYTSAAALPDRAEARDRRVAAQAHLQQLAEQFQHPVAMSPPPVIIGEKAVQGLAIKRRIVKVFVVDPDQNVPLDKSIIYRGEEKMTDLTDQELYFELELGALLKAHNEYRVTLVNKAVKERTEHLEPARIRDLSMTIVTVAEF